MAKGHESQREEALSIFTIPSGGENYSKSVSCRKELGTVLSELLSVNNTPIRCSCHDYKRRKLGLRGTAQAALFRSGRPPVTRSIPSRENETGLIEDLVMPRPIPFQLSRSEDGNAKLIIAQLVLRLARNMNGIFGFLVHATVTKMPRFNSPLSGKT
jgi:hypothetical protein